MLLQWNQVEAEFAKEYGMDVWDIRTSSWRRFRVLFEGVFHWTEKEDAPRVADSVDWGAVEHKTVSDLMQGIPVMRHPVGKPK